MLTTSKKVAEVADSGAHPYCQVQALESSVQGEEEEAGLESAQSSSAPVSQEYVVRVSPQKQSGVCVHVQAEVSAIQLHLGTSRVVAGMFPAQTESSEATMSVVKNVGTAESYSEFIWILTMLKVHTITSFCLACFQIP